MEPAQRPTPADVIYAACKEWGSSTEELLGPGRRAELVDARQEIAVTLYQQGVALKVIAYLLRRNHSTVRSLLARAKRQGT